LSPHDDLYGWCSFTQDLSVRITSHRDSTELCFVEDPRIKSSVNQNGFADRQQWDLKRKVKVWTTTTTDSFSHSKAMQPVLCTTCIVRRKYTFFWYNVVLVMVSDSKFTYVYYIGNLYMDIQTLILIFKEIELTVWNKRRKK